MQFASLAELKRSGFRPRFIIVGTGPAGMTLAMRLAERKLPSLLIEAGEMSYSPESQVHYRGEISGDTYHDLSVGRLRQFGGTSGHWAGWCYPISEIDFEPRPYVPHSGWPIRKSDLDPYLPAASELLGLTPFRAPRPLTGDLDEFFLQISNPVRFGIKYRQTVLTSPHIGLLTGTMVTDIVPGSDDAIASVQVVERNGSTGSVQAPAYCLCTGGIENSRLLLWANARHAGGVVKSPALGRFWMEHPEFNVGDAVIDRAKLGTDANHLFFTPSRLALDKHRIGTGGVLYDIPDRADSSRIKELVRSGMCVAPDLFRALLSPFGQPVICDSRLRMSWEQVPNPDSHVALGKELDRFGMPVARLHWRKTEMDRRTAMVSTRLLGEYLAGARIGAVKMAPWLTQQGEFPARDQLGGFHHMGGTRMATSPEAGVVDLHCKVFGQRNLYIAGSSVFPTSGYANPTLTIVQMSLRLADHLAASGGAAL